MDREVHEGTPEQDDEHLYHSMGRTLEIWIQALGLTAFLPLPKEVKGAKRAQAKESRNQMLQKPRSGNESHKPTESGKRRQDS